MRIVQDAVAGTLESSDAFVKVSPLPDERVQIALVSTVAAQFGDQITALVEGIVTDLGVTSGQIVVEDKGALDPTLLARVQTAILRGCDAATLEWERL